MADQDTRALQSTQNTQDAALGARQFPGWTPSFQSALERLAISVHRPARSQHSGGVRSRVRGRAIEFADYRPYSPGDDPKLVDWRAYARLGRLYLKQSEEERARTVTLLVDVSASMDFGEGDAHKGLYARKIASALAWIALNHHESIRVILLRDGSTSRLVHTASRSGAALLFRQLAGVRENGETRLGASLEIAQRGLPPGPIILLTDLLDPHWLQALEILGSAREAALLQTLAPTEWEPPLGEEVELQDSETGEIRATRLGPTELAGYRDQLDTFLTQIRQHCNRLGIIHVALSTGISLKDALLRQLPAAGVLIG